MSLNLYSSPVEFDEQLHRYVLGGKRLSGITGLIHEILQLGVYPDASEFVKKTAIPRAGEYGSSVHKSIETYDEIGIKETFYPNSYGDGPWDVSRELECYIRHRQGFRPVANEYTVSDGKWASNIDNVWQRESTGGIWLVDTKTNNLDYYPLSGYGISDYFDTHEDGLKEYLSWQLSIYAELFEAQNPGLKVEGLACNWLRRGDAAFWVIERKPAEQVKLLLEAVYHFDEGGHVHYYHPNGDALLPASGPKPIDTLITETEIESLTALMAQYEGVKAKLEAAKEALRAKMEQAGTKTFKAGNLHATIAADTARTSFDSVRFKKDNPDLYLEYITKKVTKGAFTIKIKNDD